MKLPKATKMTVPRRTFQVSLAIAAVMMGFAVLHLARFDTFVPLLSPPLAPDIALLVAAGLVISEVFALPFLLGMMLSPLARILSAILGWKVALLWIGIGFLTLKYPSENLVNSLALPRGGVAIALGCLLLFGMAYVTRGAFLKPKKR